MKGNIDKKSIKAIVILILLVFLGVIMGLSVVNHLDAKNEDEKDKRYSVNYYIVVLNYTGEEPNIPYK